MLLAMGFLHPEQGLLDQLGVEKDPRGNVKTQKPYATLASTASSPPATRAAASR